jgi:hypothetical protein
LLSHDFGNESLLTTRAGSHETLSKAQRERSDRESRLNRTTRRKRAASYNMQVRRTENLEIPVDTPRSGSADIRHVPM